MQKAVFGGKLKTNCLEVQIQSYYNAHRQQALFVASGFQDLLRGSHSFSFDQCFPIGWNIKGHLTAHINWAAKKKKMCQEPISCQQWNGMRNFLMTHNFMLETLFPTMHGLHPASGNCPELILTMLDKHVKYHLAWTWASSNSLGTPIHNPTP